MNTSLENSYHVFPPWESLSLTSSVLELSHCCKINIPAVQGKEGKGLSDKEDRQADNTIPGSKENGNPPILC